jgi:hypothetical protein
MTTTVTIKHEGPDHHDVLVEQYNPKDGKIQYQSKRLSSGEEVKYAVYDSSAIRASEIPKIVM